ncbi:MULTISPECIES: molybdenum cofactor guanylyltransferase [unclassified Sphingopyxis]|uniref:molybdenum cofactor guanylyltransferase n=1 Tax=unclassified Sphingopyxis TaxID=2614943 RepID=UPI0007374395|nr:MULTISPECIES: molybdenum cofactor guanylyltransferase [unclassified Sphingopyxis]KTE43583.1 molybdenum cofactor guanylyltransferase [Sphingopyxis sp. HIX]KTE85310.1 molybdenum cofactor guanylyltransferase [Sphingopyxis sp. HXXIV]
MKTLGAVLAGGRSSRFGSDKAEALLEGQSLLDHAIRALEPHVDTVMVAGRAMPRQPLISDWPAPDLGPMGGIAGALRYAEGEGFDQLLCISVDCVRLPDDLRALLEPGPAYLASQPVIGLWPVSLRPEIEAQFTTSDDRSVRRFGYRIGARAIACDFAPPNVNSVADLDRLADL